MQSTIFCENIGSIKDYSKETIAILKDMIQNESAENKEVLYDKVLHSAKLSTKCENAPHIKAFQMRNFCYWKLCKHNFPMQKFL